MLSTKLYKKVHSQAEALLKAAQDEDTPLFNCLYDELNVLCEDHKGSEKNHPVQWETLADFTEESDQALVLYKKALAYAEQDSLPDYIASINYSMAVLLIDCNDMEAAIVAAQKANEQLESIGDEELKQEITALMNSLKKECT